ncbi:MAG: PilZ domain-containing protein [bacterium]
MIRYNERRKNFRTESPIRIDAPGLLGSLIRPVNISADGIAVVAPVAPYIGETFGCSFRLMDRFIDGCLGKVIWVKENKTAPASWSVGLSLQMRDFKFRQLARALKEFVSETAPASSCLLPAKRWAAAACTL